MSEQNKTLVTLDDIETREFLGALEVMARKKSDQVLNPNWKCAYNALAQAADYCDAVIARSSDTPELK